MNKIMEEIIDSGMGSAEVSEPGTVAKRFVFSSDFTGFSGHFPGHPILPAFVQIMMARVVIEEAKECPVELVAVERAKFHAPIYPDAEITVSCREKPSSGKTVFDAQLAVGGQTASAFRFTVN